MKVEENQLYQWYKSFTDANYSALSLLTSLQNESREVVLNPQRIPHRLQETARKLEEKVNYMIENALHGFISSDYKEEIKEKSDRLNQNIATTVEQIDFLNRMGYSGGGEFGQTSNIPEEAPFLVRENLRRLNEMLADSEEEIVPEKIKSVEEIIRYAHEFFLGKLPEIASLNVKMNFLHNNDEEIATIIPLCDFDKISKTNERKLYDLFMRYYTDKTNYSNCKQGKAVALIGKDFGQFNTKYGKHYVETTVALDNEAKKYSIFIKWIDSCYGGSSRRIDYMQRVLDHLGFEINNNHKSDRVFTAKKFCSTPEEALKNTDMLFRTHISSNDMDIEGGGNYNTDTINFFIDLLERGAIDVRRILKLHNRLQDPNRSLEDKQSKYNFVLDSTSTKKEDIKVIKELYQFPTE